MRVPGFEQYFRRLHVYNNTRNVWFREYWQQKFSCLLDGFNDNNQYTSRKNKYTKRCRPEEQSLTEVPYNEDPKLAFVINSILSVVHGLDKMHKQVSNEKSVSIRYCFNMDHRFVMEHVGYVKKWLV